MKVEEYRAMLQEDVAIAAASNMTNPEDEFLAIVTDILISGEEFDDFVSCYYEGVSKGSGHGAIRIDGYAMDDVDKSCCLFISDYRGPNESDSLDKKKSDALFDSLKRFLKECLREDFHKELEESTDVYEFASDLLLNFNDITKFRLFLLTDAYNNQRSKNIKDEEINGKNVELNIWDIKRLFDVVNSTAQKESVEIKFSDFNTVGIPCVMGTDCINAKSDIEVPVSYEGETQPENKTYLITYTSYLTAVPGRILCDLYLEYGSRLLEGNVRSFLSVKGKVNKSIQNTIKNCPEMFFAYNNGIAATATELDTEQTEAGLVITRIKDLQIVNGGQTTVYLKETTAPQGYKLSGDVYPITLGTIIEEGWNADYSKYTVRTSHTIEYSGNAALTVKDAPQTAKKNDYSDLTINKVDTSGTALPGAEFTLYSDADCTNAIKTVQETSVQGTFTISARDSDLARYFPSAGKEDVKIYMKETTVPAGCDPSNTVYTITLGTSKTSGWNERHTAFVTTTTYSIRYQGGTTARIVNQKSDSDVVHSELTIRKGSSVETSLLNGAEFDVFSDSECTNKLTDTPIVTANGEAYINTSAAYLSTYLPTESNPTVHVYVKETKAPTGYALPDPNTPYDLTITYSKTDNDVIHYDISTGDPASKTLAIQNKPITAKDTKDASLTIYKVDEDEQPLPGAEFSLYTDENCTDALTTQSTGIDGTLKISTDADYLDSVRPQLQQGQTTASNTIYLKETKAPTGFAESSAVYPITITASSTDAWNADHSAYVTTTSYTIANNGSDSITVTNKAITSLTVTKTWNGTTGNSAKVRLTINGTPDEQNPEHTVTLSAPNWSTTFSNLPKFDSNGEEIIYGVEELDAQNYAVSSVRNADGSITITNSQSTGVTSLTVNKQWLDGASGTQAIFELVQNGEMTGRVIVLTERGGWTGKFGDLPKYDTAGNLYTYDAVEKTVGY